MTLALVDRLRALPAADRAAILSSLTARQAAALRYEWRRFWARPDEREPGAVEGRGQLPPDGAWTWWANLGGRGSGKTRSCAEWVTEEAMRLGRGCIIHLVGATIDDARATMIEGDSGLANVAPPWAGFDFKASVQGGLVTWRSGARARVFGADKASKGRGPQCNRMWLDDPAAFGPHGKAVLEQLLFGFRLRAPDGSEPRGVISSTPLESEILEWILEGATGGRRSRMVFSRSATDDNRANLSDNFFSETLAEFAGTELEQQERYGIAVDKAKGKVFAGVDFNAGRVWAPPAEHLLTVAVWVDPSVSSSTKRCECGIVVGGMTVSGHAYLLEDLSGVYGVDEWPEIAVAAVERWQGQAGEVHLGVETNRGDDQPVMLLKQAEVVRRMTAGQPGISILDVRRVRTDKSKATRAHPLPRLYQARRVHHVGRLEDIERQLRDLDDVTRPNRDRADAWVYCLLDMTGQLDIARPGVVVGGAMMWPTSGGGGGPGGVGPAPLGSVTVGAVAEARVPFSFGRPAGAAVAGGGGRR